MLQQPALTRPEVIQSINPCVESFNKVSEELPPHASRQAFDANRNKASQAYLSELPILFDPRSFQLYIACIAHGAAIGAIDPVTMGRYCRVAQTAMSCWKLANPAYRTGGTPTKGNHSEVEEARNAPHQPSPEQQGPSESPENARPLPSKGNQWHEVSYGNRQGSVLGLAAKWKKELEEQGHVFPDTPVYVSATQNRQLR